MRAEPSSGNITGMNRSPMRAKRAQSALAVMVRASLGAVLLHCGPGVVESGQGASPVGQQPPDEEEQPGGGVASSPSMPRPQCAVLSPAPADSRLLTRVQYDHTVEDLLGISSTLGRQFPKENTLLGFSNNASVHRASLLLAERHMLASEALARQAVEAGLERLTGCKTFDEACAGRFIDGFGLRAYRRPLRPVEAAGLRGLFASAQAEWGFESGIELVVQTLLQSPQFLYRNEGEASAESSEVVQLDSYVVASRLSYFLWNTMPDAELFTLAGQQALRTVEQVEAQARRMVNDRRAQQATSDFFSQWLGLDRFAGLARQAPGAWAEQERAGRLNQAWRDSLLRFTNDAFWGAGGGDVATLLGSSTVFMEAELAAIYGFSGNGGVYDDPRRRGLLAQPALLALLAHPDQTAPVQRGLFVRERLLCQTLPPPPADVDASPPDPSPDATTRERFSEHSTNARCAGCHRMVDPLGFGFEAFDHLGRIRTEDSGVAVDTSGEVFRVEDPQLVGAFDGVTELSDKLATSQDVYDCLATQWYRFAMGRIELEADQCSLERVQARLRASNGDLREAMVSLATADAFRYRPLEEHDAR